MYMHSWEVSPTQPHAIEVNRSAIVQGRMAIIVYRSACICYPVSKWTWRGA